MPAQPQRSVLQEELSLGPVLSQSASLLQITVFRWQRCAHGKWMRVDDDAMHNTKFAAEKD
jgi:hypothetical protein